MVTLVIVVFLNLRTFRSRFAQPRFTSAPRPAMLVYSGAAGMSVGFLALIVFMNVVATIWLWRNVRKEAE